eukprot:881449-Prymnesium_polylepis.1
MGHQNRRLRRREAGQLLSRQQRVAGFRIRLPGATEEEREANACGMALYLRISATAASGEATR